MWSTDVYSKAWRLLWRAGSNPSRGEEGPSLGSGSRRSRQLLHGTASILHHFTTPADQWRTDFIAIGNGLRGYVHERRTRSNCPARQCINAGRTQTLRAMDASSVPSTRFRILANAISREVDVSSAKGENPQSSVVPSDSIGINWAASSTRSRTCSGVSTT